MGARHSNLGSSFSADQAGFGALATRAAYQHYRMGLGQHRAAQTVGTVLTTSAAKIECGPLQLRGFQNACQPGQNWIVFA
jgi:hypothetical protein